MDGPDDMRPGGVRLEGIKKKADTIGSAGDGERRKARLWDALVALCRRMPFLHRT